MKTFFKFTTCLLLAIVPAISVSLINPKPSNYARPNWYAEIFVLGSSNRLHSFCKGSLIAEFWVLSSSPCFLDPFKAKDLALNSSDPTYFVKLGDSTDYIELEDYYDDPTLSLVMWRLTKPSTTQPLKLSTQTTAALENKNVIILGLQTTQSVKSATYNPTGSYTFTCRVNGVTFFQPDGFCYLLNTPKTSASLLETTAKIINPTSPGAPDTFLDTAAPFDTTGARMYLDFRTSNSYPCHEDLGAPILWANAADELEQVGVVTRVGMTLGLPMCGPSFANIFSNTAHFKDFIEATMASYEFESLCPRAPTGFGFTRLTNGQYRFRWNSVSNATGYKINYTASYGLTPLQTVDVKNITELTIPLLISSYYMASISAYNPACESPDSPTLTIF